MEAGGWTAGLVGARTKTDCARPKTVAPACSPAHSFRGDPPHEHTEVSRTPAGVPDHTIMRGPGVLYVGNLPEGVREGEIRELFDKYGPIKGIDIKIPPRPPPFAFVEFEEPRDAEDAARARDGYDFYGARLRVEVARGGNPRGAWGGGGRPVGAGRGSGYRVLVSGLPVSASWQDLKDHFRMVTKPSFVDVYRERGETLGARRAGAADWGGG
ncbi:MAG: hypothetical protein J3K34DRAFT_394371 [Monoraphidium minutum]|nr:MAG: hypothetical protein J3K34DRAFT_394371 [Monoraphidium minutum]